MYEILISGRSITLGDIIFPANIYFFLEIKYRQVKHLHPNFHFRNPGNMWS